MLQQIADLSKKFQFGRVLALRNPKLDNGSAAHQFQPAADELRQLGIAHTRGRVQVFTVTNDAWIAITADAIQDKSGYWNIKRATLYRRQGEKWSERGSGWTAGDGISFPDGCLQSRLRTLPTRTFFVPA